MNTWKIGKVLDIDISVHWTFLLLIAWVAVAAPAGGALIQVALLLSVFGCVFLHELGHAMAARQLGIRTSEIMLLPIGGVANLERMPRRPLHELFIAVAGPLVNVVIAAAIWSGLNTLDSIYTAEQLRGSAAVGWAYQLMRINIGLVLFNMLPAFPMDGGRVLRASLAHGMPYAQATQAAAGIGKVVALILGMIGFVTGAFTLVMVAAFVAFAGTAEARMVARQDSGGGENSPWNEATRSNRPGPTATTLGQQAETSRSVRSRLQANPGVVVWDPTLRKYRVVGG